MDKPDIKSMLPGELSELLKSCGQPAYRAGQIFTWLHKGVASFDEMTNIPVDLRNMLKENAYFFPPIVKKRLVSGIDSTVKYLYELYDGQAVESVLMSYLHGNTVCVSSQAGCRMGCTFCASTIGGCERNLFASEMLDQVLFTQKDSGRKIGNVVLMGIGEPLDNYDNVLRFLNLLSHKDGMNLSLRHVSLSTCGLVDRIRQLAQERLQLTLSISLHAPDDKIRSQLMPVNRKWGIDELLDACREYIALTGRRISFEYAMIAGVNDSDACAAALAARLRGMLCHVNLIPANDVRERGFKRSGALRIKKFSEILEKGGLSCTVRRTLGSDINASCGQLRRAHLEEGGNRLED
ncbi:MAG: 23S rRNA (adenine(2503)-C(2))-methyltransferase RlmN [Clostridia bacterium]|nr:23S rRNA (adenine(2503)-C(2))-methyltransferase RlmN [Clostridia bacterium]